MKNDREQNSAFIKNYGMDNPTEHLAGYKDGTILYKKEINKNYSYKQVFKYLSKYKKVKI